MKAMTETETRSHQHELTLDASPETVWRAITVPAELTRWFPLEADAKPGAGGSLTYGWGPDLVGVCRIETWEPPRHLRTSWMEATLPADATEVERQQLAVDWFIEGRGGRTVLRLVHSGFGRDARWDEEFDATRRGWAFELGSLQHYLERHRGRSRRAFWLRQPVALSAAETWRRLTAPKGLVREGWNGSLAPGDRYRFVLSSGDEVAGVVQIHTPPTDFAGTAETHQDGLFRLGFESCLGGPEAHVWLSTWGVEAAAVDALEGRWRAALAQAFA